VVLVVTYCVIWSLIEEQATLDLLTERQAETFEKASPRPYQR
jgi:hypothetical protein